MFPALTAADAFGCADLFFRLSVGAIFEFAVRVCVADGASRYETPACHDRALFSCKYRKNIKAPAIGVRLQKQKAIWRVRPRFQLWRGVIIGVALICAPLAVAAQESSGADASQSSHKATKTPQPYGGGSPLNVLMHAKLWETPPEPKPFVRESRQPMDSLSYQPTAQKKEPKRPKPLSLKQLQTLQGSLEHAGAHNERAGGVRDKKFVDADSARPRKHKAKHRESRPTQLHRR